MKIGLRTGVRLLAAAAFLAAFQGAARAADASALAGTLKEGIDLLERGQVEEANAKFRSVLAADPSNDDAYALVQTATAAQLMMMLKQSGDSRQIAERLLHMSRQLEVERSKDEAAIAELVSKLINVRDVQEQAGAAAQLAAKHGEFAVPALLPHLGSNDIDTRAAAIVGLRRIGSDAVLPLAASLGSGSEMQQRNVAWVLGSTEDARAVPALRRAAKAGGEVGKAAAAALEHMGVPGGDPVEAYLQMAGRYFTGDPAVLKNYDAASTVWSMKDGKLSGADVPNAIYGYELAEQSAYDALALSPGNSTAQAMVALCAFAEQAALENVSEEAKNTDAVKAAMASLGGADALANATGAEGLLRAFSMAARLKHSEAAMRIAHALPGVWGDRGVGADNALVAGLGNEDRGIRYAAAVALLRINPAKGFPQAGAVATIAGQAAAERAVKQVLVVDSDEKNAMNVQRALNAAGFHAVAFTSGARALAAAKATGGFDAVVVRDRLADLTTFQVLDEIGRDVRTQGMKKLVMADSDAARAAAESDFQARSLSGVVPTAADAAGVVNGVKSALDSAEGDMGRMKANALAKAACAALEGANAQTFSLKDAEAGLLDAAAEGADEDVRVAALSALGNCATSNAQTALRGILTKADNSAAVRAGAAAACGKALRGQAPAAETFDALVEAMGDADAGVRAAAGQALGQMKLSAEQQGQMLSRRRT